METELQYGDTLAANDNAFIADKHRRYGTGPRCIARILSCTFHENHTYHYEKQLIKSNAKS